METGIWRRQCTPAVAAEGLDNPEPELKPGKEGRAPSDQLVIAPAAAVAAAAAVSMGLGELLSAVVFYPFELIKSRLQASIQNDQVGSFGYSGLADGLGTVLRQDGLRGLFAGLPPVAVRSVLLDLIAVFLGEFLLRSYRLAGGLHELALALPLRVVGSAVSIIVALPIETVGTRVMTARSRLSTSAAVQGLWKEGGPRAFWSGLYVSLLLTLNPALMFTIVDWLRDRLLALQPRSSKKGPKGQQYQHKQLTWVEALLVGAVAKFITLCAVYPLIRGKVLLQARAAGRQAGLIHLLGGIVKQEGIFSLYKGFGAQLSKSVFSASLKNGVAEQTLQLLRR